MRNDDKHHSLVVHFVLPLSFDKYDLNRALFVILLIWFQGRVSWGSEVTTRWYWMQEEGSDDLSLLHPMRVETSDILEEAFSCRDVVRYQVNRNSYEADFTRMKQVRLRRLFPLRRRLIHGSTF